MLLILLILLLQSSTLMYKYGLFTIHLIMDIHFPDLGYYK